MLNRWILNPIALCGAASVVALAASGCSSSTKGTTPSDAPPGPTEGPLAVDAAAIVPVVSAAAAVAGPVDSHCLGAGDGGAIVQSTSQSSCSPDAAALGDGGFAAFGDTMWNAAGSDDDCKYDVAWDATPITEGADVYFQVTVTNRTDGRPVRGAEPRLDVFNPATNRTAPATKQGVSEIGPGVYVAGPVRFDAPSTPGADGTSDWTVRFHFFDWCSDSLDDSPHGHAAFFVNVP